MGYIDAIIIQLVFFELLSNYIIPSNQTRCPTGNARKCKIYNNVPILYIL